MNEFVHSLKSSMNVISLSFSFLPIDRPGLPTLDEFIMRTIPLVEREEREGKDRTSRTRYTEDVIPSPRLLVNESVVRNNLLDGSASRRADAIARWLALARAGNEPASSGPPPTCLKYTKRRLCSRVRASSPGMQRPGHRQRK